MVLPKLPLAQAETIKGFFTFDEAVRMNYEYGGKLKIGSFGVKLASFSACLFYGRNLENWRIFWLPISLFFSFLNHIFLWCLNYESGGWS